MQEFTTFCHISEYGEDGYAKLHRMLAASHPLVLWAPSSQLLRSPKSTVSPEQFVKYIEDGHIRIIGRGDWLSDQRYRDTHPWPSARWDPFIDDAILSILKSDKDGRRVIVAGEEEGLARADEDLARHPELIARWEKVLTSKTVERRVPAATLERVRRSDSPSDAARIVLRTAYNHGRAIVEAKAQTSFLLQSPDHTFLKILASERSLAHDQAPIAPVQADMRFDARLAEVANQLTDFLAHLDIRGADPHSFIGSEGHTLLVAWFATLCDHIRATGQTNVEGEVIGELARQLSDVSAAPRPALNRALASMGPTGLGFDLASTLLHAPEILGLGSLLTGALGVGGELFRRAMLHDGFEGRQWPFLYCYGKPLSKRSLAAMRVLLEDLKLEQKSRSTRA